MMTPVGDDGVVTTKDEGSPSGDGVVAIRGKGDHGDSDRPLNGSQPVTRPKLPYAEITQ
jgi:hypothetical protein